MRFGCLGLRMYSPFLDVTTLGLNGVLQENNTLWARCLGCSTVKDKSFRFIIRIIAQGTYLCQPKFCSSNFIDSSTVSHVPFV